MNKLLFLCFFINFHSLLDFLSGEGVKQSLQFKYGWTSTENAEFAQAIKNFQEAYDFIQLFLREESFREKKTAKIEGKISRKQAKLKEVESKLEILANKNSNFFIKRYEEYLIKKHFEIMGRIDGLKKQLESFTQENTVSERKFFESKVEMAKSTYERVKLIRADDEVKISCYILILIAQAELELFDFKIIKEKIHCDEKLSKLVEKNLIEIADKMKKYQSGHGNRLNQILQKIDSVLKEIRISAL